MAEEKLSFAVADTLTIEACGLSLLLGHGAASWQGCGKLTTLGFDMFEERMRRVVEVVVGLGDNLPRSCDVLGLLDTFGLCQKYLGGSRQWEHVEGF